MNIIDSHFHWWPRSFFDALCRRADYPRAAPTADGGFNYWRREGSTGLLNLEPEWFDLDHELAHMDGLGHHVSVVCSIGPMSLHFSDIPVEEGRDAAMHWNEEMARAQARHPGRVWASAAVPLTDTQVALDVLDHAVRKLGLMGVNLPGSIGDDPRIDAPRLEPFYARVAELGVPIFLHPTDAVFHDILEGYEGALHLSLGRVMEVSVAAMRLVFSGVMERYPGLTIIMSHTGGALPYQSGRMDKNGGRARLPKPPSTYLRRMVTDTVSPHAMGIKYAIDYYGIDHVMYGTDYPCWDPATALRLIDEIGLSSTDRHKLFYSNAERFCGWTGNAPSAPISTTRKPDRRA